MSKDYIAPHARMILLKVETAMMGGSDELPIQDPSKPPSEEFDTRGIGSALWQEEKDDDR